MCTYGISTDELLEPFEEFLRDQEGDVDAECVAESWNKLAKKYKWDDILITRKSQQGESVDNTQQVKSKIVNLVEEHIDEIRQHSDVD